jgi:hypothetical protein
MANTSIKDHWSEEITRDNPAYAKRTARYLASLRYILRKRERGECQYNGCDEPAMTTCYCRKHQDVINERGHKWKARKHEQIKSA